MAQNDPPKQSSVFTQLANRLYPAPASISRKTGGYEMGGQQIDAFGRRYPTPIRTDSTGGIWPPPPPYQRPLQHRGHTAAQHEALQQPGGQIGGGEMQGPPAPQAAWYDSPEAQAITAEMEGTPQYPSAEDVAKYQPPPGGSPLEALANRIDPQDSQNLQGYDTYDRGEALQGMPGSGQFWGDPESVTGMDAGRNWDSMPNQNVQTDLSHLDRPWYDEPEARGIAAKMEPSGIAGTEQAYQASLPQMNSIANEQLQGNLDPTRLAKDFQLRDVSPGLQSPTEVATPQQMEPGMGWKAKEAMGKGAIGTAGALGDLGKGTLGFGGKMLNAFLYGADSDKGIKENLNQTLYGGKGTLGQNLFGGPFEGAGGGAGGGQQPITSTFTNADGSKVNETYNPETGTWAPTKSSAPTNFKGAFAAARKAGKKEFTYKGKKYNTKLKGGKGITKKASKQSGNPLLNRENWRKTISRNKKPSPGTNSGGVGMNRGAKSARMRYGI